MLFVLQVDVTYAPKRSGSIALGRYHEWHLDFHNAFCHEEFHFVAWHH
jgi:hypothetical protein